MPQATLDFSGGTQQQPTTLAEPPANLKAAERIKLLYITSASFSGSTLITFLLAAHPKLATIGELKATAMGDVEKYRCSCGQRIRACAFWRRLGERLAGRGIPFDVSDFGTHFSFEKAGWLAERAVSAEVRGRLFEAARSLALRALPGARGEFRGILERNRLLVDAVCELRGTRVFVDASKESTRLQYLINSGIWDVKAVHLVRDGRGRTISKLRRVQRRFPELKSSRPALIRRAAATWCRVNRACSRVLESLPRESWVRVRYEDLCRDPKATLAPVFALVGENPPEVPENFRSIDHHILGNVMRLRKGRIALDERWRNELSVGELAIFDKVAGDLNRSMGYV